jgi:hypothetical protein
MTAAEGRLAGVDQLGTRVSAVESGLTAANGRLATVDQLGQRVAAVEALGPRVDAVTQRVGAVETGLAGAQSSLSKIDSRTSVLEAQHLDVNKRLGAVENRGTILRPGVVTPG